MDTERRKVFHVSKPMKEGQNYILQINKEAEDLPYPKPGKVLYGMYRVCLLLRKRSAKDGNVNMLEAGEVEKDLGLVLTELKLAEGAPIDGSAIMASTVKIGDGQPKKC